MKITNTIELKTLLYENIELINNNLNIIVTNLEDISNDNINDKIIYQVKGTITGDTSIKYDKTTQKIIFFDPEDYPIYKLNEMYYITELSNGNYVDICQTLFWNELDQLNKPPYLSTNEINKYVVNAQRIYRFKNSKFESKMTTSMYSNNVSPLVIDGIPDSNNIYTVRIDEDLLTNDEYVIHEFNRLYQYDEQYLEKLNEHTNEYEQFEQTLTPIFVYNHEYLQYDNTSGFLSGYRLYDNNVNNIDSVTIKNLFTGQNMYFIIVPLNQSLNYKNVETLFINRINDIIEQTTNINEQTTERTTNEMNNTTESEMQTVTDKIKEYLTDDKIELIIHKSTSVNLTNIVKNKIYEYVNVNNLIFYYNITGENIMNIDVLKQIIIFELCTSDYKFDYDNYGVKLVNSTYADVVEIQSSSNSLISRNVYGRTRLSTEVSNNRSIIKIDPLTKPINRNKNSSYDKGYRIIDSISNLHNFALKCNNANRIFFMLSPYKLKYNYIDNDKIDKCIDVEEAFRRIINKNLKDDVETIPNENEYPTTQLPEQPTTELIEHTTNESINETTIESTTESTTEQTTLSPNICIKMSDWIQCKCCE